MSNFAECPKCRRSAWLEKHHVLPQNVFDGDGDVVELCPNCHKDYHQVLGYGKDELKNPDAEFHFYRFYRWFYGLPVILLLILFYKLFFCPQKAPTETNRK